MRGCAVLSLGCPLDCEADTIQGEATMVVNRARWIVDECWRVGTMLVTDGRYAPIPSEGLSELIFRVAGVDGFHGQCDVYLDGPKGSMSFILSLLPGDDQYGMAVDLMITNMMLVGAYNPDYKVVPQGVER